MRDKPELIKFNRPKFRQDWILDLLKSNPTITYNDCFTKYSLEFTKTKRTFAKDWKVAKTTITEYNLKLNKAKDEISINMGVRALKKGLKTRFERVMFYQNQVDIMERQLTGEEKVYFIVGNKPVVNPNSKNEFILPIEKQNEIRKQIKEYQMEISKIEGDYEKHNEQKKPEQALIMPKVRMVIKEHKLRDT